MGEMEARFIDPDTLKRDPALEGALDANGRLLVLPYAFWEEFTQMEIAAFCVRQGFYCVPTVELVDWLRSEIGDAKAIEIGAGNGVLADALGIIGTDNKMQTWPEIVGLYASLQQPLVPYGERVRPMEAEKAVNALKPQVVIGAWVTHRYRESEHWRGGNMYGVREECIIQRARYIMIGNSHVHRDKPILELPHRKYEFPWLISRWMNATHDFIAVWQKGAK